MLTTLYYLASENYTSISKRRSGQPTTVITRMSSEPLRTSSHYEKQEYHCPSPFTLRFIVIEDISIFCIFVTNIPDIFTIRHVQGTFRTFHATKVIAQLGRAWAVRTLNLHRYMRRVYNIRI